MCGAAQVSRHCFVFLEGAKAALLADPAFKGGDYDVPPEVGLKALGRVWAGWALSQQFYREELYKRMGFDSVEAFLTRLLGGLLGQVRRQRSPLPAPRLADGRHRADAGL